MKYNFNINQFAAITNDLDVDVVDLCILDCMRDFATSEGCKKVIDGDKVYYWFKWSWLISQAPILKLKTRQSVTNRYNKLIAAKLIEAHPDNQIMQQALFCFGEAFNKLVITPVTKTLQPVNETLQGINKSLHVPVTKTLQPLTTKVYTDNIIIDNSTNNTNSNDVELDKSNQSQPKVEKEIKYISEFIEAVNFINAQTGRAFQITALDKKGKTDKYKLFAKLVSSGYSLEDIKAVIEYKAKEWLYDDKMKNYLQPSTLFVVRNFERYQEALKAGVATIAPQVKENAILSHLTTFANNLHYEQLESIEALFLSVQRAFPKGIDDEKIKDKCKALLSSSIAKKYKGVNAVVANLQTIIKELKKQKHETA